MRISLIHIIWILYSVFVFNNSVYGQCDVAISSWDATTGDIVIEAINSENCGCNEFTTEGNTCENSASPHVNNNETVSHIVLGLHSPGLDYNWGCSGTTNHPGWTFKVFTLFGNQVLEDGDSWSANVYDSGSSTNDCWSEMLANDTLCMELAIWQINLSQTATTDIGGWAVNPNVANQTQNYPDVNLDNNTVITCAPPACDTVYVDVETIEYVTDTITITDIITETDTITITEIDTIIITEFITDTIYNEYVVYEYIYQVDTITEYHTLTQYIDCITGLPCSQSECDETSIYAPNAVTPNADGWNDTWQVIADGCWDMWEVRIYNRWGGLVWISTSSLDEWDADVATGVYVYTIKAIKYNPIEVYEMNGYVTVFY